MENNKSFKVSTTHTFKDSMKRVWEVLTQIEKGAGFLADWITDINRVGDLEVGMIKSYVYKNIKCKDVCVEYLDTEHYKKIVWKNTYDGVNTMANEQICQLYNNTIEKNVILVWDSVYEITDFSLNSEETIRKLKMERIDVCRRWQCFLRRNIIDLEQTESIFVKASRVKVWDMMTNWLNLQIAVPTVAEEVFYNGDPCKIGTIMQLKWKKKELECKFEVTKIIKELSDDKTNEWEYIMESQNSTSGMPDQSLIFNFIEISQDYTFLSFKHDYKEHIQIEMVESVGKDKKQILSGLKKYMEKKNKNIR